MSQESLTSVDYAQSVDSRLDSDSAYIEYQIKEARRALPFLSHYIPRRDARVLEIGAGLGGKGIAYACAGLDVVALDVDEPVLVRAAEAARERGADVRYLAGDGTHLPFAGESFDAVLLDSVIEHVADPFALLAESRRVLRARGIVFVVFPPFYGPLSGHIDDFVLVPWFHLLPRSVVRHFLVSRPQNKGMLTSQRAYDVYTTLNGLTIRAFRQSAQRAGLDVAYFRVRPFLTHPGMRFVVGLVAAVKGGHRFKTLRTVFSRARHEFDLGTLLVFLVLCAVAPLVFVPFLQEIAAGGVKCVLRKG